MKLRTVAIVIEAVLLGLPAFLGTAFVVPMTLGVGGGLVLNQSPLKGFAVIFVGLGFFAALSQYIRVVECTLVHRILRMDTWFWLGVVGAFYGAITLTIIGGVRGLSIVATISAPAMLVLAHFGLFQYRLRKVARIITTRDAFQ